MSLRETRAGELPGGIVESGEGKAGVRRSALWLQGMCGETLPAL